MTAAVQASLAEAALTQPDSAAGWLLVVEVVTFPETAQSVSEQLRFPFSL